MKVQNQLTDRIVMANGAKLKFAPKNNPGAGGVKSDTLILSPEEINLPDVQAFIANGILKIVSDDFTPKTAAAPVKPGANRPRSAIPKSKK